MIGHRCRSDVINVDSSVVPDTQIVFIVKSCIRFVPHNFATCASTFLLHTRSVKATILYMLCIIFIGQSFTRPLSVAAPSKAWVCGRSPVEIVGSNPPWEWMFVRCVMLSGRGLCDKLITRPEKSYRLCSVVVCDIETSRMRRSWPALGRSATGKKYFH